MVLAQYFMEEKMKTSVPKAHIVCMEWRGDSRFRVPSSTLPCFSFHFTHRFLSLSLLLFLLPFPRRWPSLVPVGSAPNFLDHPERSLLLSPKF